LTLADVCAKLEQTRLKLRAAVQSALSIGNNAMLHKISASLVASRPKAERPPMKTLANLNPKRKPKGAKAIGTRVLSGQLWAFIVI
jgi:hypothetical protein